MESISSYLISIIIPVYNSEAFLARRIEHLLQHDLKETEIIIINDGSTDASLEICQGFLKGNENAKIITQKNQGLSTSRNKGIEEAKGEYLIFLDSDDILLYDGFSEAKKQLATEKPEVLMGKYALLREKKRSKWPHYSFPKTNNPAEARKTIYSDINDSIWNAWRYICKRDFLLNNNLLFKPGTICEDVEWTPRMLQTAKNICFLEEPFYGYYHNRQGSITRTAGAKRIADINEIVADSVPKYISEEYGKDLASRLVRESFYSISMYCKYEKNERKALRPIIEKAITQYRFSTSLVIRIFLKTRKAIPLYIWSMLLSCAKAVRRAIKSI